MKTPNFPFVSFQGMLQDNGSHLGPVFYLPFTDDKFRPKTLFPLFQILNDLFQAERKQQLCGQSLTVQQVLAPVDT